MSAALLRELRALLQEAEGPPAQDFDSMSNEELVAHWEAVAESRRTGRPLHASRQHQGEDDGLFAHLTTDEMLAEYKAVQARLREKHGDDEVPPFRRVTTPSTEDE